MYKNIQYLKWKEVEKTLKEKGFVIFSSKEFKQIFELNSNTAVHYLSRHKKAGDLVRLKKGLYSFASPRPELYLIANKLYEPSYVSLETALSYHGLIPEIVYSVTSITTKPTREFAAFGISFTFKTIKRAAFQGYNPTEIRGETVYMAEKEKAVVDYLYFVSLGEKRMRERLDTRALDKDKLAYYANTFNRLSLNKLVRKI